MNFSFGSSWSSYVFYSNGSSFEERRHFPPGFARLRLYGKKIRWKRVATVLKKDVGFVFFLVTLQETYIAGNGKPDPLKMYFLFEHGDMIRDIPASYVSLPKGYPESNPSEGTDEAWLSTTY